MPNIPKLFLLLLLLDNISSIEPGLNQDEENALEFKFGSNVIYDKSRTLFKFTYTGRNDAKIIFKIHEKDDDFNLIYPDKSKIDILKSSEGFEGGTLTQKGIYLIEIKPKSYRAEMGGKFRATILGEIFETIDLSKSVYYRDYYFHNRDNYLGLIEYKVTNLTEDKYVYFIVPDYLQYHLSDLIPYYPDVPDYYPDTYPEDRSNLTVFEVDNINTSKAFINLKYFKFEKNNEYIIKIHCYVYANEYYNENKYFYYYAYFFFPLTDKSFRIITGEEDSIVTDGPILGIINLNNINRNFTLFMATVEEDTEFFYKGTNESLVNNFDNLPQITQLNYEAQSNLDVKKTGDKTLVFIRGPSYYETQTTILIVDEYDDECRDSYSIPANKNKIILCGEPDNYEGFYPLSTFTSTSNNMRLLYSSETGQTDFIIQNGFTIPILVEKKNQEQTIRLKHYYAKFALFGAENDFLFKSFYSIGKKYFNIEEGINIENYLKMTETSLRINSKYLPWFEFYNAYFSQLNIGASVYIKQLYGGSELYECSTTDGQRDFTFLTTPISNAKCKNKKSIFNRLYSFDGTKIISGYITPNSYFEIYAEVGFIQNKEINISPILADELELNNAAKYLRKDAQYTIKFELNHMVKLDPAFNAQVTITNGAINKVINSQNPTLHVSGSGFTIKANSDAMVYFIGKYDINKWAQKEIDINSSKGKIVKVSNVDDDILLDIGFEGYNPSTHFFDFERRDNGVHYFDNMYDKLKENLVSGEKVYIYYKAGTNSNLAIEYVSKNLENKNNEFNILLIPGNNEENTLIINTYELRDIIPDFYFCHSNTNLQLSFLGKNTNEEEMTITNNDVFDEEVRLFRGDNKVTFKSNNPLVGAYLYYDDIDDGIFSEDETAWENRKILTDLKIEEVKNKKDVDNVMSIKFKPNYKQSSTRYIIIIAQQNDKNTKEAFNDPCYIVGLLNQRPSGVKVDTIYDIGDSDSITAEVDIADIVHSSNKYVVNIISHELRFDKKIHFYQSLDFKDKSGGLSDAELAMAIVFPIIGAALIGVGIFFYCKKRGHSSSEQIEKLNG